MTKKYEKMIKDIKQIIKYHEYIFEKDAVNYRFRISILARVIAYELKKEGYLIKND